MNAPAPARPAAPLTPGAYIKRRRQARRLDLADVAARLVTSPAVPEHDRIAWLERIEADIVPAGYETIEALGAVFPFDRGVLADLAAIQRGEQRPPPRLCRICACSWQDACMERPGLACSWAERDLCTACICAPRGGDVQPAPAAIAR